MFTATQVARIQRSAREHAEMNVSMAAFVYKRFEEAADHEVAEEAVKIYLAEQRKVLQEYADEAAALEVAYEEYAFERGQEM